MVDKKKRFIIGIFLMIFFIGIISSEIELGFSEYSISKGYHKGSNIAGWINVSLENETSEVELHDSEDNSIKLKEILEKGNYTYNCSPADCGKDYNTLGSGFESNSFDLSDNESVLLGFLFNEELTDLKNLSFTINSDAPASCKNQINIDFLDNQEDITVNYKTNEQECDSLENHGCYVDTGESSEYDVPHLPEQYCQRINFYPAPAYRVGSWFKGESEGRIQFQIYDTHGDKIDNANCLVDEVYYTGLYDCIIRNFSLFEREEYYLCLSSADVKEENLTIKGYPLEQGCGFYAEGDNDIPREETIAYYIFSQGLEFDTPGDIKFHKNDYELNDFEDYISERYSQDYNCLGKQCIVPLRINSNIQQTISISDIEIEYATEQGLRSENRMYELEEAPGEISFDFQKIDLGDANFSLPEEEGDMKYSLSLGDTEILYETITIGVLPKIEEISTTNTYTGYPTSFSAEVSLGGGIEEYNWDFGDGNQKITTTPETTHIYNSSGNYELTLTINSSGEIIDKKTTNININPSENITGEKIDSLQEKLENLKSDLNRLSSYEKQRIEDIVKIDDIEETLTQIQQAYTSADSESDYNQIAEQIQGINLPERVTKTRESDYLSFFPLTENINIHAVAGINSDEIVNSTSKYKDTLTSWISENIEMEVSFKEYSIFDEGSTIDKVRFFEIKTSEKNTLSTDYYLIMEKRDFEFYQDYGQYKESGYFYIKIEDSENQFKFSTTENLDFSEIPLFVSPELSKIPIEENTVSDPEEPDRNWGLFSVVIIFLLIVALIIYIILQEWYKRRYEDYLFGSKNELYNILVYIHNSKLKNLKEDEIAHKLRESGWGSEQITYAMKKYKGKRTGMIEIPVDKILNLFKKNDPRKKVVSGFNKDMPPMPKRGNLSHGPVSNQGMASSKKIPKKTPKNLGQPGQTGNSYNPMSGKTASKKASKKTPTSFEDFKKRYGEYK